MRIERVSELDAALAVRAAVFVDEQGVSLADEVDGRDLDCLHWLGRIDAVPVATLRVLPKGHDAKIQRVAVLKPFRMKGLGRNLMERAMSDLTEMGFRCAILGAQTTALGFYERLGFEPYGPIYRDAGLSHRDMTRDL
ncbi:GNAT family N-acetyltransferase [Jannaschia ovalis]|uniref:GNAT family N-acetyltransferase n=1 Tax=Jannaschia ovalis TaxID=3038773 RepID=A0ABY8L9Z7_9RHOB|nr:GNAT family N-acetyltransferase [Jannaschia sp. GRR-S6-38]WGH77193.1 GNAT family N-acetyltransferase [Jannaschia sp. GRR-S6-38]